MKRFLYILVLLLLSLPVLSQEKEKKRLPSEEINVVKPFSPTVSKAVKIPIEPDTDSIDLGLDKEINYSINSIPVASTFTPAKGKAKSLKRVPKERFYQNFISAGYGNYSTPIIEMFAHSNTSNYNDFGGFFNLHSSGGGIDGVELDDSFTDAKIDLFYKQSERYFEWKAEAGFNHLSSNWYGLSDEIPYAEQVIGSIDEKQSYNDIHLQGDIEFYDALLHKGKFDFHQFFDAADSRESFADLEGIIDFPVRDELIYTEIDLTFLSGRFKNDFLQTEELKYTYFNLGLSPNFELLREDLTLNIGLRLYYSMTDSSEGSKFYAYPNITGSYNISEESFIAYAGVVGDLQQNTYRDFVGLNPFVSPTLYIERTNQQFNAYAGIKGLLNSKIRFNLRAGYISENDKPLFKLNPSLTDGSIEVDKGYQAANSFQVVYDDVNTINFHAELIFDLFKEFQFGGDVDFNSYSLENEEHAWNLPLVTAALLAKYKRKKWSAGADLFFSSDRKDELAIIPSTTQRITNSAYLDLNLNGQYHINDKFDVFLNLNNILNQNYQEFTNFRVQGFQVFAGVKYKFDL
jgi:hypothetical protein